MSPTFSKSVMISWWVATVLFALMMIQGVVGYATNTSEVTEMLVGMGWPGYLVYVLGTVKVLGLIALFLPMQTVLKEWAYAGFFYLLGLGLLNHIMLGDGMYPGALIGLVLLSVSYISMKHMCCCGEACETKKA